MRYAALTHPTQEFGVIKSTILSNIPGVQEVHWMTSYNRCRDLFNKLKREGNDLKDFKFYDARMPGGRGQGHCKLLGPDTIDNRFVDRRYDTDN